MSNFLLERELPNLKVAVNNTGMDNDDDDLMDMDDQKADVAETVSDRNLNSPDSLSVKAANDDMKGDNDTKDSGSDGTQLENLYRSLGLHPRRVPAGTRLDTVHVRGVTDMSTEDILDYFKDYNPVSVDWINDYSCNVVWKDEKDAALTLLRISRPVLIKGTALKEKEAVQKPSGKSPLDRPSQESSVAPKPEEIVVMSEDDASDVEVESGNLDGPLEELDISKLDVPVPPGRWRRGISHSKAAVLLMRFSNKYDKKTTGAEKRSEYYKKYGNPNYGGMTGLISRSRKRRMREQMSDNAEGQKSDGELEEEAEADDQDEQMEPKRMRMKMYADEEEEKIRKKKISRRRTNVPTPPTPWSTPGNSPTSDEDPAQGSGSVWDRLSGGRPIIRPQYVERSPSPEEPQDTNRGRQYVDLDDPRLRDDYDEWEDGDPYQPPLPRWADEGNDDDSGRVRGGRSLPSRLGPVSGGDLRSKLEALRRKRKTVETVTPLRISVVNDAD
uniref:Nuclear cap-binding protein subunit 3 n=1 Tax=Ornithodoros turicata TaxID=34597 RepID=A0A2R5LL77_9ACAR